MSARRRRAAVTGSLSVVVAALIVPMLAAWIAGQVLRDRLTWSQFLFWVPASFAFAGAAACLVAARGLPAGSRPRRMVSAIAAIGLVVSGARATRWEFGWRPWAAAGPAGSLVVAHWNPQWPGRDALECGRALAPHVGDLCVISNPGSMTRTVVAREWVPPGHHVADVGQFAVVARHRIVECELLAAEHPPGVGMVWAGWVVVEAEGFGTVRIVVVDLPSDPRVPRWASARALEATLHRALGERVPDLVVGDLNATPGGMAAEVLGRFGRAAPPWVSFGWLCTFRRPWPLLRIDAMLASRDLEWCAYRTADLAIGTHRLQVGCVSRPPRVPVSGSSGR